MPLAVTHVIVTIVLASLIRDHILPKKYRHYLTLHALFIAGLGGLLPDSDIILNKIAEYFTYTNQLLEHGGFTHTPFFALLFFIAAGIFHQKQKNNYATYATLLGFGILVHIALDFLFGGGNLAAGGMLFLWPLAIDRFAIHTAETYSATFIAGLDAILLLLWLWYEQRRHNIKKFI